MDEWTGVNQNVEAQELGPEQELDILSNHCLFLCVCVLLSVLVIYKEGFFFFYQRNPLDMKTVWYCFVTFYLISCFSSISFSHEATLELLVRPL